MDETKCHWKGHRETILAVDINTNGIVSSVSEDGYCINWSKDGQIINEKLIETEISSDNVLNSIKFSPVDANIQYISSGNKILGFDLRNYSKSFVKFEFNKDEINQICLNETGKYLAACDDEGEIKIINLKDAKLFKTLFNQHTNICSSIQFRCKRPWQVISVGLDSTIIHWDYSTGKCRQNYNINEHLPKTTHGEMFINPPLAHTLSTTTDGWNFAVGLGNGDIGLFHFQGKTFHFCKSFQAHNSTVNQVYYHDDKSLFSGGNDGHLKLWRNNKETEMTLFHEVNHGSKINWITSNFKDQIFVADQSSNINIYQLI